MRKIDLGQMLNTLANIGVIAGIVFLGFELSQNNELLELEAQATSTEIILDGWDRIATHPDLVHLFIKDRNEEELTEAEEMRMSAYWMGYLIRQEFVFQYSSISEQRIEAMGRIFDSYGSLRRTWNGSRGGSRSGGKDNFSPEYVDFVENTVSAKH